ncbi:MAG TPA: hypothetical protein VLD55_01985 [Candidatus Sulfobium mesophilum]|jgi:hypothetical protein|nr:hypothetical protein [Candidatus Sulfobium mesophilum]
MIIRVIYTDGNYDLVKDLLLDQLIYSGRISKFYRSGKWAVIGRDRVRGMGGVDSGVRRRRYDH